MIFDNAQRFYDTDLFEYVSDPIIEYAESGSSSQVKIPKGKLNKKYYFVMNKL